VRLMSVSDGAKVISLAIAEKGESEEAEPEEP
jgi:hypothetical protein